MLRVSVCVAVFAVWLYTAQSDPVQKEENAEQKWFRVNHTYRTLNRASYYKVYEEPLTWFDAIATCANDGSHLLIINSLVEATDVKRYLDTTVDTYIIGFHDLFEDQVFRTVQCESLVEAGYNEWAFMEPTNFSGEDCGGINNKAELIDIHCNIKYPFVCEYET